MFKKLRNLFSSKHGSPSPEEKAKAVYFVLISHGNTISKDILNSSPEQFQTSYAFKEFLANEIGVILCLNSTREGYERFFEDSHERELFTARLSFLFKNHLHIPWDIFLQYINLGENAEEPDKLFMHLFAGRIFAFLRGEENLIQYEKLLMFSYHPEAMVYVEFYVRIFEMVVRILKEFAGKDASALKIIEMSNKLDESFG